MRAHACTHTHYGVSTFITSSKTNYLSKALFFSTIMLGIRVLTYEFGVHKYLVHNKCIIYVCICIYFYIYICKRMCVCVGDNCALFCMVLTCTNFIYHDLIKQHHPPTMCFKFQFSSMLTYIYIYSTFTVSNYINTNFTASLSAYKLLHIQQIYIGTNDQSHYFFLSLSLINGPLV